MRVILLEDVENLGRSGEVVSVKDGYGRNFLVPRRRAVMANEKNVRQLEHQKATIAARQAKLKGEAESAAKALSAVVVTIRRKVGDQDKLFGSVTALDVAEALSAAGHPVDRRHILLQEPIKALGTYEIEMRMHREVHAKVKVEVVAE